MTALRLIIVGLGARARIWLKVGCDNPNVQIVALCDPDPNARAKAGETYPGLPIGTTLADVIGTQADAVLLCSPPGGREAQIEACCKAGVAILAEKPLADDITIAARYVEMAEAAGVHLIVGLNFRYLAVTQAMRRLLQDQTFGSPGFGRFTYERWRDGTQDWLNSYSLTMDHPMLWEQSIHHFDLMRYVYGTEPVLIQAHTFNPSWTMYAGDANVSALIAFENGLTVNYQGTWQSGHLPMNFSWRTDCSEGVVVQREMFGDLAVARRMESEMTPVPLPKNTPWISDATELLKMFVATCRGSPPECTGRDHLQSLQMLQGCILASERRATVEIEEINAKLTSG